MLMLSNGAAYSVHQNLLVVMPRVGEKSTSRYDECARSEANASNQRLSTEDLVEVPVIESICGRVYLHFGVQFSLWPAFQGESVRLQLL